MPLPRLTRMQIGYIGVAVVILWAALPKMVFWTAYASIPLEFLILDAKSGRPIQGASVEFVMRGPEMRASTGQDGVAKVVGRFRVGGRADIFQRTRAVNYYEDLRISADGYHVLHDELDRYTGMPRYHSEPIPPRIVIRLEPAQPKPDRIPSGASDEL